MYFLNINENFTEDKKKGNLSWTPKDANLKGMATNP